MKITISYQKDWSEDGTVYDQKVKMDEYYRKEVNMYLQANLGLLQRALDEGLVVTNELMRVSNLTTLDTGINYTNLTTGTYVKQWLEIMGVSTNRYLDRNTIIEFI